MRKMPVSGSYERIAPEIGILVTNDRSRLYIGGRWTAPSSGDRITVRSASTEEVIGSVPEAVQAE